MSVARSYTPASTDASKVRDGLLASTCPNGGTVSPVKISVRAASSRTVQTYGLRRFNMQRHKINHNNQYNTQTQLATVFQTCRHIQPPRNFPPGVQQHVSVLCALWCSLWSGGHGQSMLRQRQQFNSQIHTPDRINWGVTCSL